MKTYAELIGNYKKYKIKSLYDNKLKVSRILAAKSDAIGFVHRDENSNLCIQFGTDGEVLTGARPQHLANKDIVVAERAEDGSFISHWDRIYPSLEQ